MYKHPLLYYLLSLHDKGVNTHRHRPQQILNVCGLSYFCLCYISGLKLTIAQRRKEEEVSSEVRHHHVIFMCNLNKSIKYMLHGKPKVQAIILEWTILEFLKSSKYMKGWIETSGFASFVMAIISETSNIFCLNVRR